MRPAAGPQQFLQALLIFSLAAVVCNNRVRGSDPIHAALQHYRISMKRAGRSNADSLGILRSANRDHPQAAAMNVDFQMQLASSCREVGDVRCALAAFEKVLLIDRRVDALNGLALLLSKRGRHAEAAKLMREATKRFSKNAGLFNNAGTVYHTGGKLKKAARAYSKAWKLSRRQNPIFGYNYANSLLDQRSYALAVKTLRSVAKIKPDFPEVWWKLGRALAAQNKYADSVKAFQRAHPLAASGKAVKFSLASLLYELHDSQLGIEPTPDYAGAFASLQKALNVDPHEDKYLHGLLHLSRYTCNFATVGKLGGRAARRLEQELQVSGEDRLGARGAPTLSPMRGLAYLDGPVFLRLMRLWADDVARRVILPASVPRRHTRDSARFRVGLVSADWGTNHPMMHLLDRLLLQPHNLQSQIESQAFALHPLEVDKEDQQALRRSMVTPIGDASVRMVSLAGVDDIAAAATIQEWGADVVFDLNGFTAGGRPEIFHLLGSGTSLRVGFLGWPATVGSSALLDAMMTDRRVTIIERARELLAEKLIVLGRSVFVGDHAAKVGLDSFDSTPQKDARTTKGNPREILGLPRDGIVFANFNQLFKFEPRLLGTYSRVLARTCSSTSVLWLLRHPAIGEPAVLAEIKRRGVRSARVVFSDFAEKATYLARAGLADLFLDNPRYNAGATGVDALWAKVPMLTLPGIRGPSRFGLSQASRRSPVIVHSHRAYEDLAVRIGKHRRWSASLRRHFSQLISPDLFDGAQFRHEFDRLTKAAHEAGRGFHVFGRQNIL